MPSPVPQDADISSRKYLICALLINNMRHFPEANHYVDYHGNFNRYIHVYLTEEYLMGGYFVLGALTPQNPQ